MIDSSRTHLDILRDSLELIKEQSRLQNHYIKGCVMHDKYCDSCQQNVSDDNLREEHNDDCHYYVLIEELEAWVRAEEEVQNV